MMSIEELDERKKERGAEAREKLAMYGDHYEPWLKEALQAVVTRSESEVHLKFPDKYKKCKSGISIYCTGWELKKNFAKGRHRCRHCRNEYDRQWKDAKVKEKQEVEQKVKAPPSIKPKYSGMPEEHWFYRD